MTNKTIKNTEPDEYKLALVHLLSSLTTILLVFFYLAPLLWQVIFKITNTTLTGVGIVIYFVINIILTILAVKIKAKLLINKPFKFEQIYIIVIGVLLLLAQIH